MPELVFKMVRWKMTPRSDRSIARLSPFGGAIIELDSFPKRPKRPQDLELLERGSETKKAHDLKFCSLADAALDSYADLFKFLMLLKSDNIASRWRPSRSR